MVDIVCPEKRSKMMAHISSHDTTPELYFRKLLYAVGIRYRLKVSSIIGHPDIQDSNFYTWMLLASA